MLLAVDRDHHVVEMPLVVRSWPVAPDAACEIRTEPVEPEPHRLTAHHNTALRQKILDIRRAPREPVIDPDHVSDDIAWVAKAFQVRK